MLRIISHILVYIWLNLFYFCSYILQNIYHFIDIIFNLKQTKNYAGKTH